MEKNIKSALVLKNPTHCSNLFRAQHYLYLQGMQINFINIMKNAALNAMQKTKESI